MMSPLSKSLLRSKRLCFGLKTATSQIQSVMDSILPGIKGVVVRADDILLATSGGVITHMAVIKQVSEDWQGTMLTWMALNISCSKLK